jgi:RNA polymerase sigma-70 factor (ECF subfamily)
MAVDRQEVRRVLLAQSGDREALEALLRSVQEPLYRYVLGLLGANAAAQDVVQEVLVRIYLKLRWLREPELFRPWAYRIATREAFRCLRRQRRLPDPVQDESLLDAVPAEPRDELASELQRHWPELLSCVSPASRAALILHYQDGMTLFEAAEVLGVAVGTVKSRLAYGLAALRREMSRRGLLAEPPEREVGCHDQEQP